MAKRVLEKNYFMLKGELAKKGYDWWWHSFTGYDQETGEMRPFFIEYFVINPALGGKDPILGQLPENKAVGNRPSYVMIKAGCWGSEPTQIHNFFGINELQENPDLLEIRVGHNYLSETQLIGSVEVTDEECQDHPEYMCNSGTMSWELKIDKKITYDVGYGTSPFMRKLNAFEMFWHVQGMRSNYTGKVVFNGRTYDIIPEKSYGYADKNWGADFTSPWLWLNSNNLVSKINGQELLNSSFDAGGGRPRAFGITFDRKILIGMYYEGELFEYNFSKPWLRSNVEFAGSEDDDYVYWQIRAKNKDSWLEVDFKCLKTTMLHVNYEAPDGFKRHNKLWNGGMGEGEIKLYRNQGQTKQLIDHLVCKNAGCEYGEYN
ncbi:MAG: tocopherol cyclase family protein [Methylocystaceae bacterium]